MNAELLKFTAPFQPQWMQGDFIWGSGHDPQTAPWLEWRARPALPGSAVLLIGRPGVEGCITAMAYREDLLDVAFYDEKPEEILASLRESGKSGHDAMYKQLDKVPGWGLEALRILAEYREGM
jgi:hypothetical protein